MWTEHEPPPVSCVHVNWTRATSCELHTSGKLLGIFVPWTPRCQFPNEVGVWLPEIIWLVREWWHSVPWIADSKYPRLLSRTSFRIWVLLNQLYKQNNVWVRIGWPLRDGVFKWQVKINGFTTLVDNEGLERQLPCAVPWLIAVQHCH